MTSNFNIEVLKNLALFIGLEYVEYYSDGKFSLASPLVTGWLPSIVGCYLIIVDVLFNIFVMDWWAEGNIYLMFMQVYTFA